MEGLSVCVSFCHDCNSNFGARFKVQSNLFNTDTKGTEPGVRFTEMSVL